MEHGFEAFSPPLQQVVNLTREVFEGCAVVVISCHMSKLKVNPALTQTHAGVLQAFSDVAHMGHITHIEMYIYIYYIYI